MRGSPKENRPTTAGALVEVLLVLAIGIGVVGACRGWFMYSTGTRIRPTGNNSVELTAPIAAANVDSEVAR